MKQASVLFTLVFSVFLSCQLESDFTEIKVLTDSPATVSRCGQEHVVGGMWLAPKCMKKKIGDEFENKLMMNTGEHLVGAISVQIVYNPEIISPNMNIGDKGVETDVFVLPYGGFAVNILHISDTEDRLFIAAYHANGVEPSPEAFLFDLNWTGVGKGRTDVTPDIQILTAFDPVTYEYYTPGTPTGYPGRVKIK